MTTFWECLEQKRANLHRLVNEVSGVDALTSAERLLASAKNSRKQQKRTPNPSSVPKAQEGFEGNADELSWIFAADSLPALSLQPLALQAVAATWRRGLRGELDFAGAGRTAQWRKRRQRPSRPPPVGAATAEDCNAPASGSRLPAVSAIRPAADAKPVFPPASHRTLQSSTTPIPSNLMSPKEKGGNSPRKRRDERASIDKPGNSVDRSKNVSSPVQASKTRGAGRSVSKSGSSRQSPSSGAVNDRSISPLRIEPESPQQTAADMDFSRRRSDRVPKACFLALSIQERKEKERTLEKKLSSNKKAADPNLHCGRRGSTQGKIKSTRRIFMKYRNDNQVHRDDLPKALEDLGFMEPNIEWVEQVYEQITQFSAIGELEFERFVEEYVLKRSKAHQDAFRVASTAAGLHVNKAELPTILHQVGINPLKYILDEVINEVCEEQRDTLDIREFEKLMDIIEERLGFAKSEQVTFRNAHERFDLDRSGEIDTSELENILDWIGYTVDHSYVAQVVQEVDRDGSKALSQHEFLRCMRKIREHEIQIVRDALAFCDEDGSGTLSLEEIEIVFKKLGYIAEISTIYDAMRSIGLSHDDKLDLSEVWQVLNIYRRREGFDTAEELEIQHAFQRYDFSNEGHIDTLQVSQLLRLLGICVTFEEQSRLVDRVDVDETGTIDLAELKKIARLYYADALEVGREQFHRQEEHSGYISVDQAVTALHACGYKEAWEDSGELAPFLKAQEGDEEPCIDLDGFLLAVLRFQKELVKLCRANFGFTNERVKKLHTCFSRFDKENSGHISRNNLAKLIEQTFPGMAYDKQLRPRLVAILKEVDAEGHHHNGMVGFSDFLRVSRRALEAQDQAMLQKWQKAIQQTSFSREEVREFRLLFSGADVDKNDQLSHREALGMITAVCPLDDGQRAEFKGLFHSVQSTPGEDLDFPDFLCLMWKLLDVDFACIKSKTSVIVNQNKKGRQSMARRTFATGTWKIPSSRGEQPVDTTRQTHIKFGRISAVEVEATTP